MGYKPIESYGVIGDLHTVALVGIDGSIDWCCLPHFDSPSVFAAILDDQKGGSFRIASLYEAQHKQMYMPDSNVLVTRFLSDQGVGEVVDFMPVQGPHEIRKIHQIVRVVRAKSKAGRQSRRKRTDPRTARTTRTIWWIFLISRTPWTGMKSATSPTPWSLRKRVTRTLLSGMYICFCCAS